MSPPTALQDDATPISAPLPPPPPAVQPTGPVESLPSLPSPPAPARVSRRPRNRTALAGRGLGIAALLVLEAGTVLRFGRPHSLWTTVPLWCGFATLAAVVGLLVHVRRTGAGTGRAWRISAAGLVGLAVFWVLVALPVGDTDRGFVLTAALGCLGASLWLTAGRKG
jgi:hypothetical protein